LDGSKLTGLWYDRTAEWSYARRKGEVFAEDAYRCHTTERDLWIRFVEQARAFEEEYRAAAERWLDGVRDVVFPPDCFPPPLTFMRVSEPALVPS